MSFVALLTYFLYIPGVFLKKPLVHVRVETFDCGVFSHIQSLGAC